MQQYGPGSQPSTPGPGSEGGSSRSSRASRRRQQQQQQAAPLAEEPSGRRRLHQPEDALGAKAVPSRQGFSQLWLLQAGPAVQGCKTCCCCPGRGGHMRHPRCGARTRHLPRVTRGRTTRPGTRTRCRASRSPRGATLQRTPRAPTRTGARWTRKTPLLTRRHATLAALPNLHEITL